MANQNYTEFPERSVLKEGGSPPPTGPSAAADSKVSERTRSYPAPGKTQSKDRSAGVPRARIYPQSKGL